MNDAERAKYESPSKRELEELLAKHGQYLSSKIRKHVEDAIGNLDHTDPGEVIKLLPSPVLAFYQHTLARAVALTPLIAKAHQAGCFIESIILSHGLIQFALRGLYVVAWQRTILPSALSDTQLAPYYKQGSRQGDVSRLVAVLEENGIILDFHAKHLRSVNDIRNRAAHGVIFGEIDPPALEPSSGKSQYAALGALDTLRTWFNNPRPLQKASSTRKA
jgi:hypothetical protein